MTYGCLPGECSGYCSGWQSFLLDYGEIARQLKPLESQLPWLRGWMNVPLQRHEAARPGNPKDGQSPVLICHAM